ncbi:uncharacterized protein LOC144162206 [Haemaphysalis longicornis]
MEDSYKRRSEGAGLQFGGFVAVFLMCISFCGLLIALLVFLFNNKNMECAKPTVIKLDTGIRSVNTMMTSNDNGTCDHELKQAWYTFETPYGNRMPDYPVYPGMCNTMVPFWFYGSHPEYPSMPMPAIACGADEEDACAYYANIRVQHCGSYIAYYLQPLPRCFMAYCIGERMARGRRRRNGTHWMGLNFTENDNPGTLLPEEVPPEVNIRKNRPS